MTDTQASAPAPKGVLLVLTDPDGDVIASATDFEQSALGGFSLLEGQKLRAKGALAGDLIRRGCAPYIAKAMDDYEANALLDKLVRTKGCRIIELLINRGEDKP